MHSIAGQTTALLAAIVVWACVDPLRASAQSLEVDWTNRRLTVLTTDVPLDAILTEVAARTGSTIIGLENASDAITIDIRDALLRDALKALLGEVDHVYALAPAGGARVRLFGPSTASAAANPCVRVAGAGPRERCDEATMRPDPQDAYAVITAEPFPRGPSPADAEVARLNAEGFFNSDAPESQLLSLAKAADPGVRVRALETLAVQAGPAASQALEEALRDENAFVRGEALGLLTSLGPGSHGLARLGELLEDADAGVRVSAALALGEQDGTEAGFLLRRALADKDSAVRAIASELIRQEEGRQVVGGRPRR